LHGVKRFKEQAAKNQVLCTHTPDARHCTGAVIT